jgi:hypothetical protein
MVIIPRGKPILENLNSYYLKIANLLEHYQGELGSGGIFFTNSTGKGVLFFDQDEILSGYYQNREQELVGKKAIEFILDPPSQLNFMVSVYAIDSEDVYFWTSIPGANILHDNLSSEFTDLEALIKKMTSEKLTGYIDITISHGDDRGLLFFQNGNIVGDSQNWEKESLKKGEDSKKQLVMRTKKYGGVFRVFQITMDQSPHQDVKPSPEKAPYIRTGDCIPMLNSLLYVLEKVVVANRKVKSFNTLLKKKFIEKADTYVFLDPFAGEFKYEDNQISFVGDAGDQELVAGVTECVRELSDDLGLRKQLVNTLAPWFQKYQSQIERHNVTM